MTVENSPTEKTAIKNSFERLSNDEKFSSKCTFPKRYILALLGFLGFCNVYCMRTNLSVAIVAMVNNRTEMINGTKVTMVDFDWSPQLQGLLLASFFWGYVLTQLPGGFLASRFGGRILYGCGVLFTGILTLLTPPASHLGIGVLIAVRFFEGLFEGVTYPAMHTLWSKWAPPLECSKLTSISVCGSYFGMMLSLPLSGFLAHYIGWPAIFYFFGSMALIWFGFWIYFTSECPEDHKTISSEELSYLNCTIGLSYMQYQKSIPWKSLFTSLPLYAIAMSHFSENWGFYTMMTELPTFLHDITDNDLSEIGMLSAIPYFFMSVTIVSGGQIADFLRSRNILSTVAVRKIFTCSAFLSQVILMIVIAYVMTPVVVMVCLTISIGMGGFAWSGFNANMLDIAPQYAGLVMGISNTLASIPGIVAPIVAGQIVQNKSPDEWRIVFYVVAAVYCVGAAFYGIFASGKLQHWAQIKEAGVSESESTASEIDQEQRADKRK